MIIILKQKQHYRFNLNIMHIYELTKGGMFALVFRMNLTLNIFGYISWQNIKYIQHNF